MKWTTQVPTTTGAYWYRSNVQEIRIVLIRFWDSYLFAIDTITQKHSLLKYWNNEGSEWAGPIPVPTESE